MGEFTKRAYEIYKNETQSDQEEVENPRLRWFIKFLRAWLETKEKINEMLDKISELEDETVKDIYIEDLDKRVRLIKRIAELREEVKRLTADKEKYWKGMDDALATMSKEEIDAIDYGYLIVRDVLKRNYLVNPTLFGGHKVLYEIKYKRLEED